MLYRSMKPRINKNLLKNSEADQNSVIQNLQESNCMNIIEKQESEKEEQLLSTTLIS